MTTVDNKNAACILYVDHQGHPAPLSECFHATASRRLSSTVDRQGRPSTITQVDSAYCPQCLSFHDATSGSQLGFCPKPTCLQCPLCASIVSCSLLQEGEGCFGYTCGKCDWNSTQCNLTIKTSSTEATKEEMTEASTKLFEQLEQKRQLMKKPIEDHYRKMVAAWEGKLKPSASAAAAFQSTKSRQEEAWSVAALETAMDKKKHDIVNSLSANIGGLELQKISLEDEIPLDSALQDQPIASLALQARMGLPASSMLDLLPLSVPLRPRKSRRCRAELSEGKPGILLKPKLNPLEGDSSLRTGHGQWWKKVCNKTGKAS